MNPLQYVFIALAVVLIAIILTQNGRGFLVTASLIVGTFALGPAFFLQVVIDKVLGQRSIETLNFLGWMLFLVIVLGSLGAFALDHGERGTGNGKNRFFSRV